MPNLSIENTNNSEVTYSAEYLTLVDGTSGSGGSTNDTAVAFDDSSYENKFTSLDNWGKRNLVDSPAVSGGSVEVAYVDGDFEGVSSTIDFADGTEEAWIQYYMLTPSGFDVGGGLKAGMGFWNDENDSGAANGGTSDGLSDGRAYSVRPDMHDQGGGSYNMDCYTYHANMGGSYGEHISYGSVGELSVGTGWHRFDHHIKLNTPGKQDGVLESWIDTQQGINRQNLEYRGSNYSFDLGKAWFDCYWGGSDPSPASQSQFFDELRISTSGPIATDL